MTNIANISLFQSLLQSVLGRTRATEDIDLIIEKIDQKKFQKLHAGLISSDFVCMQYDYLISKIAVRYTRRDLPLPEMEMK